MTFYLFTILSYSLTAFLGALAFSLVSVNISKLNHKEPLTRKQDILCVEMPGAILGILTMHKYGNYMKPEAGWILKVVFIFTFLMLLTIIALTDWYTMQIPNKYVGYTLIFSVISLAFFPEISLISRGIGMFCVSVPLFLLALIIPGSFGGGDMKLMVAVGVFLGWQQTGFALIVGVFSGGFYGIYLLLAGRKKRKEAFAFGPFLCAGVALALLK